MDRDRANASRFVASGREGHYESWFQRANHPSRPLAFWNRYTVFSPIGAPNEAVGELWGIWFDGERDTIVALREDVPIARCRFDDRRLDVRIGEARLADGTLAGSLGDSVHRLAWDLTYRGGGEPLLLLPEMLYRTPFPKAKALSGSPGASFVGSFGVDGEVFAIDGWIGSQNHNWGSRQTDEYGWAQVAGFDGAEESFLECIAGRVRISSVLPIWIPKTALVVLRHEGRTYSLNSPWTAVRATSSYEVGDLRIETREGGVEIDVRVTAPRTAFVGLTYRNPPGGFKICHNTKVARCEVHLRENGRETVLRSANRAALEILRDEADGVPVVV